VAFVDAENFDSVTAARNVKAPVPGSAYECWLSVEGVVPAANHELEPALSVHRNVDMPGSPCKFVLLRHLFWWNIVPDEASIRTHFDSLRPTAASTISPALDRNFTVVHNYLFVERLHDRAAHRHFLDLDASGVGLIVFSDLAVEIQVLLRLHRSSRWMADTFDSVQPLAGPGTYVSKDNGSKRIAMDFWELFAIHFPRKQNFVVLDFGPWGGYDVVHDLTLRKSEMKIVCCVFRTCLKYVSAP